MILVTGAAGKTGRAIIRALVARGAQVRALAHRPDQSARMSELGAQEVIAGDMNDPTTLENAARGVTALYAIFPNMHPDEVTLAEYAIAAAQVAGNVHFVYHSVLHPQTEQMPHHWQKLRVEERLFESGLPFTILQPAAYMQNVLGYWTQIVDEGRYPLPYAVATQLGMVDLEDVAAAAAAVLTSEGHGGAIYELAGAEILNQTEIAAHLSAALGRPVRAEAIPRRIWETNARTAGLGDYQVDALLRMFRYYEEYGFWGNPNALTWLLGRSPTLFAAFCEREFSPDS